MPQLKKTFGIDLGTTYSCVAYVDEHGKAVTVKNAENESVTPSVVFFDGANVIVGSVAKENAKLYPDSVVEMIKRHMGDPNYTFEYQGERYRPEQISAFILRKVVKDAEQLLGEEIKDVVITCPAYFGVNEREATARAGELAGLNVKGIINEPTAAALAYGLLRNTGQREVVLVYDLGGGTFDVTMIEIHQNELTTICTGGDHYLGGRDWDAVIVKYLAEQFANEIGSAVDILDDPETRQALFSDAEKAKKTLTAREKAPVRIVAAGETTRVELTREKFDDLTNSLLQKTVTLTQAMLAEARAKGHERFDRIILVGGSTRMPQVANELKKHFPDSPIDLYNPDECVAQGAALYAWKLAINEEIIMRTPDSATQEQKEAAAREVFSTFALPSGAEKIANTTVVNVSSKTFGIVAVKDKREIVANLICRNTPVPANVFSENFSPLEDNQESVEIRLMENLYDAPEAAVADSTELGRTNLPLPPGLKAGSRIQVRFQLDNQGRLHLDACEPTSGKTTKLYVETASVMSPEELRAAKSKAAAVQVS